MTIVLDLTERQEDVSLRAAGFESCSVQPLGWLTERGRLLGFYRNPARANASAFVDELLALCLTPRRRAREVKALPPTDRARLRRAAMAVCGLESGWRALYGSHLNPDERVFALMYSRWQGEKDNRVIRAGELERLAAEGRQAAEHMARNIALDPGGSRLPASILSKALLSATSTGVKLPELFRVPNFHVPTFDFVKGAHDYSSLTAGLGLARPGDRLASAFGLSALQNITAAGEAARVTLGIASKFETSALAAAFGSRATVGASLSVDQSLVKIATGGVAPWAVGEMPTVLDSVASPMGVGATRSAIAKQLGTTSLGLDQFLKLPAQPVLSEELRRSMRELDEALDVIERFNREWESHSLFYLLARLNEVCEVMHLGPLAALQNREQVEVALLFALEAVVADGEFIPTVRAEVARAPYLNDWQRDNIDHGLEHAAEAEWNRACSSLYAGVEGAFQEVARAQNVLTLPTRTGEKPKTKFESAVRRLDAPSQLKTFTIVAVFGNAGDAYRHGAAADGHRRQVLFLVAALAGWLEQFASTPVLEELAQRMAYELPLAANRARTPQLVAG